MCASVHADLGTRHSQKKWGTAKFHWGVSSVEVHPVQLYDVHCNVGDRSHTHTNRTCNHVTRNHTNSRTNKHRKRTNEKWRQVKTNTYRTTYHSKTFATIVTVPKTHTVLKCVTSEKHLNTSYDNLHGQHIINVDTSRDYTQSPTTIPTYTGQTHGPCRHRHKIQPQT